MLTKHEYMEPLARLRRDEIVVTTMGAVRTWGELSEHEFDFASADSAMGHAADLALGLALARPERRVICLNGDGSMLMTLGTLVTAAASEARNLILIVAQNATFEITGGQPVPGGNTVDFAGLARSAGWRHAFSFSEPDAYREALPGLLKLDGPVFIVVHIAAGQDGPLKREPGQEVAYLRESLADSAHRLRARLTGRPANPLGGRGG